MLLYRLQEEVHRYTVSRMEGAKRKTLKTSSLQKIPGIGPAKAAALLKHFTTLSAVREASLQALTQVKGVGAKDAEAIYRYFHAQV
jgi:excinuclease ABC subunit C